MKTIIFQQENAADGHQPWSVVVDEEKRIVHGRPDADYLIGFGPKGSYEIDVAVPAVLDDPSLAVGLCPVYTGSGEMFSVDLAVKTCSPYDADETALAKLRAQELVYREALHG